jgi:hypothetical protein
MLATKKLDAPTEIQIAKLNFNRKLLGQIFKGDQQSCRWNLGATCRGLD